jgi:hypothetical protein
MKCEVPSPHTYAPWAEGGPGRLTPVGLACVALHLPSALRVTRWSHSREPFTCLQDVKYNGVPFSSLYINMQMCVCENRNTPESKSGQLSTDGNITEAFVFPPYFVLSNFLQCSALLCSLKKNTKLIIKY